MFEIRDDHVRAFERVALDNFEGRGDPPVSPLQKLNAFFDPVAPQLKAVDTFARLGPLLPNIIRKTPNINPEEEVVWVRTNAKGIPVIYVVNTTREGRLSVFRAEQVVPLPG